MDQRIKLETLAHSPNVATQLRCGGIASNHFIAYFHTRLCRPKIFENLSIFWRRCGQKFTA